MSDRSPCTAYPDDAHHKTIGLYCPLCETWECWRRYLSWEKMLGITLNERDHPSRVDDHVKRRLP